MRILQKIILKLMALGLLAVGILLLIFDLSGLYDQTVAFVPDNTILRYVLGAILIVLSIFALLPWLGRRPRSLTLSDGETTLRVKAIEKSIREQVNKLPEVKKASVEIRPAKDLRRARVESEVVLVKAPGASLVAITTALKAYMQRSAENYMGAEVVENVGLDIKDIKVDDKATSALVPEGDAPAPEEEKKTAYAEEEAGGAAVAAAPAAESAYREEPPAAEEEHLPAQEEPTEPEETERREEAAAEAMYEPELESEEPEEQEEVSYAPPMDEDEKSGLSLEEEGAVTEESGTGSFEPVKEDEEEESVDLEAISLGGPQEEETKPAADPWRPDTTDEERDERAQQQDPLNLEKDDEADEDVEGEKDIRRF
jgi:hypothetical protein